MLHVVRTKIKKMTLEDVTLVVHLFLNLLDLSCRMHVMGGQQGCLLGPSSSNGGKGVQTTLARGLTSGKQWPKRAATGMAWNNAGGGVVAEGEGVDFCLEWFVCH
jgi:hypothetical protein